MREAMGKDESPTGASRLELLLFRLGEDAGGRRELFGINVFKVREVLEMPPITATPGAPRHVLGIADLRGQVMPVIDLPAVVGCRPQALRLLIVTEFERSLQGFAVEGVEQIVRLEWSQVVSAQAHAVGGLVGGIARLDPRGAEGGALALVLDLERILGDVLPERVGAGPEQAFAEPLRLPAGSVVLAVDDSFLARGQIEKVMRALGAPCVLAHTGAEAWQRLQAYAEAARAEGRPLRDKVALVLTDLEMPEMDGFTLVRRIKGDELLRQLPVVIHSSLTGQATEEHARAVGADGYVTKFSAGELAAAMRAALAR
ncbi:chemotaxis protein [Thiomonas sp. FB-6]|uniref:chemotaxis protein n=1 Tax=Thiomonas sp. FB-6 TaxID=1158291 RepID=UPI00035CD463|nr:chemotaxis protein [Thiomonas sp. FB-6]